MLVVGITDDLHCLIYSTYMFMGGGLLCDKDSRESVMHVSALVNPIINQLSGNRHLAWDWW